MCYEGAIQACDLYLEVFRDVPVHFLESYGIQTVRNLGMQTDSVSSCLRRFKFILTGFSPSRPIADVRNDITLATTYFLPQKAAGVTSIETAEVFSRHSSRAIVPTAAFVNPTACFERSLQCCRHVMSLLLCAYSKACLQLATSRAK